MHGRSETIPAAMPGGAPSTTAALSPPAAGTHSVYGATLAGGAPSVTPGVRYRGHPSTACNAACGHRWHAGLCRTRPPAWSPARRRPPQSPWDPATAADHPFLRQMPTNVGTATGTSRGVLCCPCTRGGAGAAGKSAVNGAAVRRAVDMRDPPAFTCATAFQLQRGDAARRAGWGGHAFRTHPAQSQPRCHTRSCRVHRGTWLWSSRQGARLAGAAGRRLRRLPRRRLRRRRLGRDSSMSTPCSVNK